MEVMNTSGNDYEFEVHFEYFKFKPFEIKEIYRSEQAEALCTAHSKKGMVLLKYTPDMQAKYPTREEFLRAKRLEGLKALHKQTMLHVGAEKAAERDVISKMGPESTIRYSVDASKIAQRLKKVEEWIADLKAEENSSNEEEAVETSGSLIKGVEESNTKPKEGRKRRGRPPAQVEVAA